MFLGTGIGPFLFAAYAIGVVSLVIAAEQGIQFLRRKRDLRLLALLLFSLTLGTRQILLGLRFEAPALELAELLTAILMLVNVGMLGSLLWFHLLQLPAGKSWLAKLGAFALGVYGILILLPGTLNIAGVDRQVAVHISTNELLYVTVYRSPWGVYLLAFVSLVIWLLGIQVARHLLKKGAKAMGIGILAVDTIFLLLTLVAAMVIGKSVAPPTWIHHLGFLLLLILHFIMADESASILGLRSEIIQTQKRLHTVTDRIPGVVYQVLGRADGSSSLIFCSGRLPELLGLEVAPEHTFFERLTSNIHPEDRETWMESNMEALTSQASWHWEGRYLHPDGRELWIRGSSEPETVNEGVIYSGILQDCSDEKIGQRERELLHKEVEARNQELEGVMYSVSHDLRAPLVNIQGFGAEAMAGVKDLRAKMADDCVLVSSCPVKKELRDALEQQIDAPIQRVQSNTLRLANLLTSLLKLTRLGRQSVMAVPVDPRACLAKVEQGMAAQLTEANGRIEVENLPTVVADETQLQLVFQNLLSNALRYRHPNRPPVIRVSARELPHRVEIRFEDNGTGFSPDYAETIFKPFHRLEPKKTDGEGIGLTIVRRTLDRMHGYIRAEGREGEGAAFLVNLPAVERVTRSIRAI